MNKRRMQGTGSGTGDQELTPLSEVEFEDLFSKVDRDASGSISFDEYFAWQSAV